MRYLWISLAGVVLLLPAACDSGDDVPARRVPHTVPPASISSPIELPDRLPVKPVKGSGPVYETALPQFWG